MASSSPLPLVLGAASIGGRVAPSRARAALRLAFDLGVRAIDLARSYGYGEAEAIVGAWLAELPQSTRDEVFIATKVGLAVAPPSLPRRLAKDAARVVFDRLPSLRRALAPRLGRQTTRVALDAASIRTSLDESLRALRVSHVDVLFLHDPTPDDIARDEVRRALEAIIKSGDAARIGIAGGLDACVLGHALAPEVFRVLQTTVNAAEQNAASFFQDLAGRATRHALQPFGGDGGADTVASALRIDRHADPEAFAQAALAASLAAADRAVVAMFEPAHIQANVRAVERIIGRR